MRRVQDFCFWTGAYRTCKANENDIAKQYWTQQKIFS